MSLFGSTPNKPAGLSINTGSANLFSNASSQPAAAGGLFGSSSAGTSKPPTTSLFGSTAVSSTPSAGTLFGAGTSNTTATTAPSLFGGLGSTASAPSAAGTLFGGAAAATSKPGGMFGTTPTVTTTTSTPAAGGLFGSSLAPPQPASTAGGGLFGAATMTAPAPTSKPLFGAAPGGLFGSSTTGTGTTTGGLFGSGTTGNAGGGLFGGSTAATTAPAGGFFGAAPAAANPPPNQSLFGNPAAQSTMARPGLNHPAQPLPQQTQRSIFTSSIGQYTASQAAVPGVRIDATNLRPTTRFADLHEVLQHELERLDTLILRQQEYADECTQAMPAVAAALAYVPSDADFCRAKLDAVQSALESDAVEIDDLKKRTRACADDAKISFKNISALRTPAQYGGGGGLLGSGPGAGPVPPGLLDGDDVASLQGRDLAGYMTRQVADMETRLSRFRSGLAEVETYLQGVEAGTAARVQSAQMRIGSSGDGSGSGGVRSADDQVRELAAVLRDFEAGILAVAGNVGAAREATQEVMMDDSRLRGGLRGLY